MTKLCLIAGNYREAQRWARAQMLDDDCWFYPDDEYDLRRRSNYHVLVIGTAGENVPSSYFERIFRTAQECGRINRK